MSDPLWAAMQLSEHPDVCDALARGLPVRRDRLRAGVLAAIDEPPSGADFVLTDEIVLRCEVSLNGVAVGEESAEPVEPFALSLDEFIAQQVETPVPLLGDDRNTIIPAGGLVLIAGRPGIGKTTLAVDLAFHLASGLDWLGFKVARPLRVLLIENEGPVQMFRDKLRHKQEHWLHPLKGGIDVQTWRWGCFSFRANDARERIFDALAERAVDVVIGDPLGTLGMEGVGSPEDVRNFVGSLVELGLTRTRAFVFSHHFRKEGGADEITQLQGAWGGPLDTLITLKETQRTDEIRLNVPKLRHGRDALKPLVVGLIRETASFKLLGEEGGLRPLAQEIAELLADGEWRTRDEIARKSKGGIRARAEDVEACLAGNAHLFRSGPGDEHGRSSRATLWQLVPAPGTSRDECRDAGEGQVVPDSPSPPTGEGVGTSRPPDSSRRAGTGGSAVAQRDADAGAGS
jgi:nucleoside-triphosphatase THEP1